MCGAPLTPGARFCPRCKSNVTSGEPAEVIEGTRMESVEEIRQAFKAKSSPAAPEAAQDDTLPFRPARRPPMALLGILDDGREDGEWLRLRSTRTVIGRTEGDIRIPHDEMISGRHCELIRQADQSRYRWFLNDLQSTNGTFVRVGKAQLRHGQEILLGGKRWRFDAAPMGAETPSEDSGEQPKATRGWKAVTASDLLPSLVELTPEGQGEKFLLTQPDNRVGRNPKLCTVVLSGDPLVSPLHVRIYRDAKERWQLENCNAHNGVWLRINKVPLEGTGQFQVGEQRFVIKISW
jgi:hypothetical protein